MCIYTYICIYMCIHIYVYICIYICIYIRIYICIYICLYMYIYVYLSVRSYLSIYLSMFVRAYIYLSILCQRHRYMGMSSGGQRSAFHDASIKQKGVLWSISVVSPMILIRITRYQILTINMTLLNTPFTSWYKILYDSSAFIARSKMAMRMFLF